MEDILTPKEIASELKGENLMNVARETKIAYDTIRQMVAKPDHSNPTYSTLKKLTEYINGDTDGV